LTKNGSARNLGQKRREWRREVVTIDEICEKIGRNGTTIVESHREKEKTEGGGRYRFKGEKKVICWSRGKRHVGSDVEGKKGLLQQ